MRSAPAISYARASPAMAATPRATEVSKFDVLPPRSTVMLIGRQRSGAMGKPECAVGLTRRALSALMRATRDDNGKVSCCAFWSSASARGRRRLCELRRGCRRAYGVAGSPRDCRRSNRGQLYNECRKFARSTNLNLNGAKASSRDTCRIGGQPVRSLVLLKERMAKYIPSFSRSVSTPAGLQPNAQNLRGLVTPNESRRRTGSS